MTFSALQNQYPTAVGTWVEYAERRLTEKGRGERGWAEWWDVMWEKQKADGKGKLRRLWWFVRSS